MNRKIAMLLAGAGLLSGMTAVFAQSMDGFDPDAIEALVATLIERASSGADHIRLRALEPSSEARQLRETHAPPS